MIDNKKEALKQFIDFLIYLGHRADMLAIRAAANKILAENGSPYQVKRDSWVRAWAREISFSKPPKAPYLLFYDNSFGCIIKLDPDSTKTIIGYTNKSVAVN